MIRVNDPIRINDCIVPTCVKNLMTDENEARDVKMNLFIYEKSLFSFNTRPTMPGRTHARRTDR